MNPYESPPESVPARDWAAIAAGLRSDIFWLRCSSGACFGGTVGFFTAACVAAVVNQQLLLTTVSTVCMLIGLVLSLLFYALTRLGIVILAAAEFALNADRALASTEPRLTEEPPEAKL